jgi:hypothetical protein
VCKGRPATADGSKLNCFLYLSSGNHYRLADPIEVRLPQHRKEEKAKRKQEARYVISLRSINGGGEGNSLKYKKKKRRRRKERRLNTNKLATFSLETNVNVNLISIIKFATYFQKQIPANST